MSTTQLWKKEPFRVGLVAGMTKSRVFQPDLFFTKQWDQIHYERGYHFSSFLKSKGVRVTKVPKTPPKELLSHLYDAFKSGALL
jgi:hypothetical protein